MVDDLALDGLEDSAVLSAWSLLMLDNIYIGRQYSNIPHPGSIAIRLMKYGFVAPSVNGHLTLTDLGKSALVTWKMTR